MCYNGLVRWSFPVPLQFALSDICAMLTCTCPAHLHFLLTVIRERAHEVHCSIDLTHSTDSVVSAGKGTASLILVQVPFTGTCCYCAGFGEVSVNPMVDFGDAWQMATLLHFVEQTVRIVTDTRSLWI